MANDVMLLPLVEMFIGPTSSQPSRQCAKSQACSEDSNKPIANRLSMGVNPNFDLSLLIYLIIELIMEAGGVELRSFIENTEVIENTTRTIRKKRKKCSSAVHGMYTDLAERLGFRIIEVVATSIKLVKRDGSHPLRLLFQSKYFSFQRCEHFPL